MKHSEKLISEAKTGDKNGHPKPPILRRRSRQTVTAVVELGIQRREAACDPKNDRRDPRLFQPRSSENPRERTAITSSVATAQDLCRNE
jgi:hypothetical protein